jgi:hypothetical protein
MTAILRAALLVALLSASIPAVAAAQGPPTDSLLRRIELLERRSAGLEQRVLELEVLVKAQPSGTVQVPPVPGARGLQNWRRLRRGMNMDEVRALLGEPERVDAGYLTFWRWGDANVSFVDGKLDGWSEPRR